MDFKTSGRSPRTGWPRWPPTRCCVVRGRRAAPTGAGRAARPRCWRRASTHGDLDAQGRASALPAPRRPASRRRAWCSRPPATARRKAFARRAGAGARPAQGRRRKQLAVAVGWPASSSTTAHAEALVAAARDATYLYRHTKPSAPPASKLRQGDAAVRQGRRRRRSQQGLARGAGHRRGRRRWRANAPTGRPTTARRPTWPSRPRSSARSTASRSRCWTARTVEKLGMGSFLAVAQGSRRAAALHRRALRRRGQDRRRRSCWSARASPSTPAASRSSPPAEMDEMKFDMGGAASVLGTLRAVAELKPKLNLVGIIPTCENMPERPRGQAGRRGHEHVGPDDRDPEHRRRRPADPVRRADLRRALQAGGGGRHRHADRRLRDRARPPPLRPVHAPTTRSPAQLLAAGAGGARPVLAHAARRGVRRGAEEQLRRHGQRRRRAPAARSPRRCSCKRFTGKYRWAHLDIAGTAWKSGAAKGATGRPVPLLTHFVLAQARADARGDARPLP